MLRGFGVLAVRAMTGAVGLAAVAGVMLAGADRVLGAKPVHVAVAR